MASGAEVSADEFTITRVFSASRQRVWDAWTKRDQLARWFGPKGVTATVQTHDLRPDGIAHIRLVRPDGGQMWAKFVYREVTPPSRLVWCIPSPTSTPTSCARRFSTETGRWNC